MIFIASASSLRSSSVFAAMVFTDSESGVFTAVFAFCGFAGSEACGFATTFGFAGFLVAVSIVAGATDSSVILAASESGRLATGFAAMVFVASESSVLSEPFFTLNGLGVVVE